MWSQLPYDIINEVANWLDKIEDFLAFSSVCKSWRSVYRDKAWLSRPKIPWLMLDTNQNGELCFGLYKTKILKIPLPMAHDRRIWGSSYGWLIMISPDLNIQLLNPITRVKHNLAPISTFEKLANVRHWFDLIHKASVLKLGTEFLVFVIYGPCNSLAFVKLGETTWTTVESQLRFVSFVCYKGKILGLSVYGTLAVIEIDERMPPTARRFVSPPVGETCWQKLYLAESCDDLLLVYYHFRKMVVYRLDLLSQEWKKMESLGERVLFVDEHSCLSASSFGAASYFMADCIYDCQDNLDWCLSGDENYARLHIYDLKRNYSIMYPVGSWGFLRYKCPVWLIPSLW